MQSSPFESSMAFQSFRASSAGAIGMEVVSKDMPETIGL